ncbi:MAG TPA: cell division protein ZipA [Rhodanobacteraceae bacterium]|nr:cell division protein ZipA [Rhodanobacteraceae bacterium]
MEQQVLSSTGLRVLIGVIGLIALALIYFFGRPQKPGQGRRRLLKHVLGKRIEPTLGAPGTEPRQSEFDMPADSEAAGAPGDAGAGARKSRVGVRPEQPIERIVTLFVAARGEAAFAGPDLIVAAEKAGLEFGDMGIFHRPVFGKPEQGPIFSMANMVKPGSFDMARLEDIRTPGVSLFMTLPGPLSALDAWDTLLPTAQRLAELLDGVVLDEGRNALGRQRIAHLRDELRAWDRKQESGQIRPRW